MHASAVLYCQPKKELQKLSRHLRTRMTCKNQDNYHGSCQGWQANSWCVLLFKKQNINKMRIRISANVHCEDMENSSIKFIIKAFFLNEVHSRTRKAKGKFCLITFVFQKLGFKEVLAVPFADYKVYIPRLLLRTFFQRVTDPFRWRPLFSKKKRETLCSWQDTKCGV